MRAISIAAIFVAAASPARADKPKSHHHASVTAKAPPSVEPKPPPSVNLPQGKVRVDVTGETEMSSDKVAKPVSVAPDLAFGATDDLMIGIVTSKFATTGFRGAAGGGFCASGSDMGCAHVFSAGGVEAWYALSNGGFATAFGGGPYATNIDQGFYGFKLGIKAKLTAGRFVSTLSPSVFVAATKRTDYFGMAINKDLLYVPVTAGVRLTRNATVALGSGVKGPLEGFGTGWQVPLGISATYAIVPDFTIGASWVFGQLVSGATNPPPPDQPVEGMDLRVVQVWASYTR